MGAGGRADGQVGSERKGRMFLSFFSFFYLDIFFDFGFAAVALSSLPLCSSAPARMVKRLSKCVKEIKYLAMTIYN